MRRAERGGGALVKADTKLVCDGVKKMIWPRRQNTNLSRLGKAMYLLSLEMFLKLSTDGLKHMKSIENYQLQTFYSGGPGSTTSFEGMPCSPKEGVLVKRVAGWDRLTIVLLISPAVRLGQLFIASHI